MKNFLALILLICGALLAMPAMGDPVFKSFNRLVPDDSGIQREISPSEPLGSEFEKFIYVGTFQNSIDGSFDLFSDKPLKCKGAIQAEGKVVSYEGGKCKEAGQGKCGYAGKRLFLKTFSCIE